MTPKPVPTPQARRSERRWLWALVVLTGVLRGGLAINTSVISTDSEFFLWMAQDWKAGHYQDALFNLLNYHPLYSILTAYTSHITGDVISAAYLLSVVCSTLLVFPIHALVRSVWNAPVAHLTVFLYAIHPRLLDITSDTRMEPTFFLFFFTAVALVWIAWRTRKVWPAALAGLAGAFAYLTRLEGIYLPVYVTGMAMARGAWALRARERGSAWFLGRMTAIFLVLFTVGALPYMWQIHERTGTWHITMKGTIPSAYVPQESEAPSGDLVLSGDQGHRQNRPSWFQEIKGRLGDVGGATAGFLVYLMKSGTYFHIPLVVLGILLTLHGRNHSVRGDPEGQAYHLLWSAGILAPIYLSLCLWRNDTDSRYFLPAWIFLFPWAGVALLWLHSAVLVHRVPSPRARRAAVVVALLVLSIGGLGKFRKVRRGDQSLIKEAGRVIRELSPAGQIPRVLATRWKIAFYAGARPASIYYRFEYENILAAAREEGIPFVAGLRKDFERADPEWFESVEESDVEIIPIANPSPRKIDDIVLYRIRGVSFPQRGETR